MKTDFKETPRVFEVKGYKVKDMGRIRLEPDEMVTFVTESGRECDFAAREWGFYLGPSLNGRLKNQGFKVALVLNEKNQLYTLAVEAEKMDVFKRYLKANQDIRILCWLDEWVE